MAARFLRSAPSSPPPAGGEPRTIVLSEEQRALCEHGAVVRAEVTTTANACEDCVRIGEREWVHLRVCMTCGGVRCCDSSKNKHASQHFRDTDHPIMHSYERGETWAWCYVDELTL